MHEYAVCIYVCTHVCIHNTNLCIHIHMHNYSNLESFEAYYEQPEDVHDNLNDSDKEY